MTSEANSCPSTTNANNVAEPQNEIKHEGANYRRRSVKSTDLPKRLAAIDNTMRQNNFLFHGTSRGAMAR